MSFTINLDPLEQIVKVNVEGSLDNQIRSEILSKIAGQMKSTNYSKAIIDLRQTAFNLQEPIEGSVELTMHLSNIGMSPAAKLAFIYRDAETHRKTFEKISQKVGYGIRYFKNAEDAYSWLKD